MTTKNSKFSLPSVKTFINESRKKYKINEAEETAFGDEISKINDWFKKKYTDPAYQFKWSGDKLQVLDGEEKEVESLTREDLVKEIDGFPATAVKEVKANEAQIDGKSIVFGSFGGSMNTSISTDLDDEKILVFGLNSSSYGHKEYYKQFDAEPSNAEQDKERKAVMGELKKLADKFDNDVIAALKKLGYE